MIAAELIRAKQEAARTFRVPCRRNTDRITILFDRGIGRDEVGEDRHQDEQKQDDRPKDRRPVLGKIANKRAKPNLVPPAGRDNIISLSAGMANPGIEHAVDQIDQYVDRHHDA